MSAPTDTAHQEVLTEVVDGVAIISLNAADRLNSLNDAMNTQLAEAVVAAELDDAVRVIVFTGKGKAFCVGADMARLEGFVVSRGATYDIPRPGGEMPAVFRPLDPAPELNSVYTFAMALTKPVIAAVNGPAVGAGFLMAAFCDLRFASTKAMFNAAFGARGLIAEAGMAWRLPRLVGEGNATDIILSGRRVQADEALAMGLVNRVVEPEALMAVTLDYAKTMANTVAPRSLRLMKRQLQNAARQTFAESATEAYDLLRESLAHDDLQEGVRSFKEKRLPNFTGR